MAEPGEILLLPSPFFTSKQRNPMAISELWDSFSEVLGPTAPVDLGPQVQPEAGSLLLSEQLLSQHA